MKNARALAAVIGILVPYLARIPGMSSHGTGWLTSYFGDTWWAPVFFQAFNAAMWVPILLWTKDYQHPKALAIPVILAFAFPLYLHSTVDLAADAQAAIALIVIPFFGLPGALIGTWLGRRYDRALSDKNS